MPAINSPLTKEEWQKATDRFGPWIHKRARRIVRQLPPSVGRNLYEDLVGVGFRGFVEAMHRLDPARPESSDAYIKQLISGAMLDELRRLDPLSRDQRRRQRVLRDVERSLTRKLQRPPTAEEMASTNRMTMEEYHRVAAEAPPLQLSMDAPLSGEGDPLVAYVASPDGADPQEQSLELERRRLLLEAMNRLPSPHRSVVQRYYIDGDTLTTIGNGLNVCAARASQIRKEAVERMRQDVGQRLAS